VYPAQVSKNGSFLTGATSAAFKVVRSLSRVDTDSWAYLSQNGSDAAVLEALKTGNVHRMDLEKIAFRMRDRRFFTDCIALLRKLNVYHHTLWSYGLLHDQPDVITQYLQYSPYADRCGVAIRSPLLTIDPVARLDYQHLEYHPLVNARAHRLGARRKILNERFYQQYLRFTKKLCYQADLDDEDRLAAVYYLLLQGRISEALKWFGRINPQSQANRIQYDYLRVYLDFFAGDTDNARAVAKPYAQYPVVRWQQRFQIALDQLDEIGGKPADSDTGTNREVVHSRLAGSEPSLDFGIEARRVTLHFRNLKQCRVNYYPMDVELLFSRSPFLSEQSGDFTFIQPRDSQQLSLPENGRHTFDLPPKYHHSNIMVEIVGGGLRKAHAYYANSLEVAMIETYGRLRVHHADTGRALPKTYVKVYARMRDGQVRFFKDGYTDLRGHFDYVSLSSDELDRVERFAILLLNDEFGAVIKTAAPPQR
jgi:hypothetical protein